MNAATKTTRELRNKDTGIDLSVPTHKQTPGLITNTVQYDVLVVSILQTFKSPKHKESDVVQYTILHKLEDFAELYSKLEAKFPGTMLPPFPKKALVVKETVIMQRRNMLDQLMKFIAKTPKLSDCANVLEFLGIRAIKAGKFRKDVESRTRANENENEDLFGEKVQEKEESFKEKESKQQTNLFDEPEADDLELFGGQQADPEDENHSKAVTLEDLFPPERITTDPDKLFDDQDFGGAVNEVDDADLFVIAPDSTRSRSSDQTTSQMDDNSDLLNIDDDLEKFFKFSIKKETVADTKPSIPIKPSKPSLAPKPKLKNKPSASNNDELFSVASESKSAGVMATGDIMNYIEQNINSTDNLDNDLFS